MIRFHSQPQSFDSDGANILSRANSADVKSYSDEYDFMYVIDNEQSLSLPGRPSRDGRATRGIAKIAAWKRDTQVMGHLCSEPTRDLATR